MRKSSQKTAVATVLAMLVLSLLAASVSPLAAAEGYAWVRQDSGTTIILNGISGLDASHIWAVGGDEGAILFYDGSNWTRQSSQEGAHFYAVHALDKNNVWAVGYDGLIAHFNGSNWEDQSIGDVVPFSGVYAADAKHVWAVGGYGAIYFYDGTNWTQQFTSATISGFEAVSGTDKDHVWAVGARKKDVGYDGGAAFFNGTAWSEIETGAPSTLFGVCALDTKHVWASGGGGEIRFFNGSKWSGQTSGIDEILEDVSASSTRKAYAVSDAGTILAFNGSSWTKEDSGINYRLTGAYALDDDHAWACGDQGIILARQPSQPKPNPTKSTSRTWGHDSIGVSEPAKTWYLAEGSTGAGFETWVLVQNPNNTPANVTLTYMTTNGPVKGPSETLTANSRKTYDVSATVQNTWEVSTKVQANVPVIAERAMYGNGRTWGHDSIGVSEPAKTWYLAEGSTGTGFETWVLVQNPNDKATKVSLTYMTSTGPEKGPQVTIPANSRKTFNVADTVANEWEISTMVDSDLPVIAERAMYGQNRTWGHDSIGVSSPARNWYLAEGCTGTGFETWVLVQNPNAEDTQVELTYMTAEGPVQGPSVVIPARSRKTFDVSKDVPNNYSVSTLVSGHKPVIAERAMYGGNRTWGHDSIGTTAPNPTWYLAEGSTGQGFETWVLVQNPNAEDAQVHLTFMTSTGEEDGPSVTVPGKSRVTVNVAETVSDAWEVSTKVSADRPVITERAMYGDPK